MFQKTKALRMYQTPNGKIPFEDWLTHLPDRQARALIRIRLDRLLLGLPGKYRSLGDDVYELKIHFGPGYRIYFGHEKRCLILLLCAGNKSTQSKDILKAKKYWNHYRRVKNESIG